MRRGERWAFASAVIVTALGLAVALPAHDPWELATFGHLGPVYLAVFIFLAGVGAAYRALELDVPGYALGLLAASYAVFPLLLAVPTGGLVDRLGERRLMAIGSGVVLASSIFLLLWGSSIVALVIGTAFLGAGQLACVVGQQAVLANNAASSRMDSAFGYLTFAASLGQALGPLAISLVGGASVRPASAAVVGGTLLLFRGVRLDD